jgi:hypothetical protein
LYLKTVRNDDHHNFKERFGKTVINVGVYRKATPSATAGFDARFEAPMITARRINSDAMSASEKAVP